MNWKCHTCGVEHSEAPTCFGFEALWRQLVPESQFELRVVLSPDICIVDEEIYFIRGHIQIPISGNSKSLQFSVWSSLSERSFQHMGERWESPDRGSDPPYFGWLSSNIAVYPTMNHLKLSVQSCPPGETPIFLVEPSDHQLSIDQRQGISTERWYELVHILMHTSSATLEKKVSAWSRIRRLFWA